MADRVFGEQTVAYYFCNHCNDYTDQNFKRKRGTYLCSKCGKYNGKLRAFHAREDRYMKRVARAMRKSGLTSRRA